MAIQQSKIDRQHLQERLNTSGLDINKIKISNCLDYSQDEHYLVSVKEIKEGGDFKPILITDSPIEMVNVVYDELSRQIFIDYLRKNQELKSEDEKLINDFYSSKNLNKLVENDIVKIELLNQTQLYFLEYVKDKEDFDYLRDFTVTRDKDTKNFIIRKYGLPENVIVNQFVYDVLNTIACLGDKKYKLSTEVEQVSIGKSNYVNIIDIKAGDYHTLDNIITDIETADRLEPVQTTKFKNILEKIHKEYPKFKNELLERILLDLTLGYPYRVHLENYIKEKPTYLLIDNDEEANLEDYYEAVNEKVENEFQKLTEKFNNKSDNGDNIELPKADSIDGQMKRYRELFDLDSINILESRDSKTLPKEYRLTEYTSYDRLVTSIESNYTLSIPLAKDLVEYVGKDQHVHGVVVQALAENLDVVRREFRKALVFAEIESLQVDTFKKYYEGLERRIKEISKLIKEHNKSVDEYIAKKKAEKQQAIEHKKGELVEKISGTAVNIGKKIEDVGIGIANTLKEDDGEEEMEKREIKIEINKPKKYDIPTSKLLEDDTPMEMTSVKKDTDKMAEKIELVSEDPNNTIFKENLNANDLEYYENGLAKNPYR